MTQLKEMVNVVAALDTGWKCPFEHEPVTHNKTNTIPPPKTEKEVADRLALQNVERLDFYLTKKSL